MNKHAISTSIISAFMFSTLSGCNNPKAANEENFAAAINILLAEYPACTSTHIDTNPYTGKPPEGEYDQFKTPDKIIISHTNPDLTKAYQALVKAGVFKAEETKLRHTVRYLFGKPDKVTDYPATLFTLNRTESTPKKMTAINLCFATREVATIDQFTEPQQGNGVTVSRVKYSDKFSNIAPWSSDSDVRKVWTGIEKTLEETEKNAAITLGLTNKGWSASF